MNQRDIIEWDSSFDTGVTEIDEQHRILVNTLNDARIRLTDDADIDLYEQINEDLLSYALYHFETEEALMQKYGYVEASEVDAERHLQQHRSFSSKVVTVRDNLRAGIPITSEELISFLSGWLVNHILNTDKKLGSFILTRRAAQA